MRHASPRATNLALRLDLEVLRGALAEDAERVVARRCGACSDEEESLEFARSQQLLRLHTRYLAVVEGLVGAIHLHGVSRRAADVARIADKTAARKCEPAARRGTIHTTPSRK